MVVDIWVREVKKQFEYKPGWLTIKYESKDDSYNNWNEILNKAN